MSLALNEIDSNFYKRIMKGDVFEYRKNHNLIVISNDEANKDGRAIICCDVVGDDYRSTVNSLDIRFDSLGVLRPAYIKPRNIRVVSRQDMGNYICTISPATMELIDNQVKGLLFGNLKVDKEPDKEELSSSRHLLLHRSRYEAPDKDNLYYDDEDDSSNEELYQEPDTSVYEEVEEEVNYEDEDESEEDSSESLTETEEVEQDNSSELFEEEIAKEEESKYKSQDIDYSNLTSVGYALNKAIIQRWSIEELLKFRSIAKNADRPTKIKAVMAAYRIKDKTAFRTLSDYAYRRYNSLKLNNII